MRKKVIVWHFTKNLHVYPPCKIQSILFAFEFYLDILRLAGKKKDIYKLKREKKKTPKHLLN